jgi:hypothetical protein
MSPGLKQPFLTFERLDLPLPWDKIGVLAYLGETSEEVIVDPVNIKGKGVIVGHTVCELRPEWMQSRLQI